MIFVVIISLLMSDYVVGTHEGFCSLTNHHYKGRLFSGKSLNSTDPPEITMAETIFICCAKCKRNNFCVAAEYHNRTGFNCLLHMVPSSPSMIKVLEENSNATVVLFEEKFCQKFSNNETISISTVKNEGFCWMKFQESIIPVPSEKDQKSQNVWHIIQKRFDGSISFSLPWQKYKMGFGNLSTEFWLGNDNIHQLTKDGNMKLRFDLNDGTQKKYAEYSSFIVDNEIDMYKLHIGVFSGNTSNSFAYHNGQRFSTTDKDYDSHSAGTGHCANNYKSGWWYNSCHRVNINGKYDGTGPDGMSWHNFHAANDEHVNLHSTTMKVEVDLDLP